MIKVSHEVPLDLLESSRLFNDYDYALVHLFEVYPKYLEFYVESLQMGREVLLDNSIFELKEAFDMEEFAKWVQALAPTKYIIPDVLDDGKATIQNVEKWNREYRGLPGKTMGVVQGKSYEELTQCYFALAEYVDEICICFPHSHHMSKGLSTSEFHNRMLQRQQLINKWLDRSVINRNKKHHLLGCLLPQEFKAYKGMDWIYSLDTSNPILHGAMGVRYSEEGELDDKIPTKMADIMELELGKRQWNDIVWNIMQFKNNLR